MGIITLTSITLGNTVVQNVLVNIKIRKTSDPDLGFYYANKGDFFVKPDGTFVTPVVISGLDDDTSYIIWATIACSNSSFTKAFVTLPPTIPCGTSTTYSGGEGFPTENIINLGSSLGTVTLTYDAFSIPDKFQVFFDGVKVIDTGYKGDTSQQSALDSALAAMGLPSETITTPGSGTATFSKGTATTTATVRVYSPLAGTSWNYTLSCPV